MYIPAAILGSTDPDDYCQAVHLKESLGQQQKRAWREYWKSLNQMKIVRPRWISLWLTNRKLEIPRMKCAVWYPVPESDLPDLLPDLTDWKPEGTGKGPLAESREFCENKMSECQSPAEEKQMYVIRFKIVRGTS